MPRYKYGKIEKTIGLDLLRVLMERVNLVGRSIMKGSMEMAEEEIGHACMCEEKGSSREQMQCGLILIR